VIAKSTVIEGRVVNPAGVRRRLSVLPREVCAVSWQQAEVAARRPDRSAEVSRGQVGGSAPPKARTVEVVSRAVYLARAMWQKKIRSS